jgi:hypothetical protein
MTKLTLRSTPRTSRDEGVRIARDFSALSFAFYARPATCLSKIPDDIGNVAGTQAHRAVE